jgi:Q family heterogeneous nuclear ribonucleoprotein R
MMDFTGNNRGYCFITYTSRADAKRAAKELNDFEIRNRRYLGACLSVDNCRLFVGGIPRNKQKEEILEEMKTVADGVIDAIVYPSITDKTKNRGFAFIEFETHRAAAMARRKLLPGRIQLWGQPIAVDWAEPEQEVDEDVMAKVRILYVRNLMLSTTEETLEQAFSKAAGKENCIERVKKLKDYAFIHFRDRQDAVRALQTMNGANIDGSLIEVVLAKPVDRDSYHYSKAVKVASQQQQQSMSYPMTSPPAAYLAGAALYPTPLPTATTTVNRGRPVAPRVPAVNTRAGRNAAGSRGAGGVSRGYLPRTAYRNVNGSQERLYDILPGMELTPTNPLTLKPHLNKSPVQVLEEFCVKNAWPSPQYQLHSAVHHDIANNTATDVQLFVFKVYMPSLSPTPFMPNKLCRSVEDAKKFAAENVLAHLGFPVEITQSGSYPFAYPSPVAAYQY